MCCSVKGRRLVVMGPPRVGPGAEQPRTTFGPGLKGKKNRGNQSRFTHIPSDENPKNFPPGRCLYTSLAPRAAREAAVHVHVS